MSITSNRKFVADLAAATISIFDGGQNTATSTRIARAHFGDRSYNLNVVYDVQHHLKRIKAILDADYNLPVVLVHKDAYDIIKAGGPVTRADAMKCLPSGKGRTSDGIHLCETDDLIYEMSIELNLRRAAGKEKRNMDRLMDTASPRAPSLTSLMISRRGARSQTRVHWRRSSRPGSRRNWSPWSEAAPDNPGGALAAWVHTLSAPPGLLRRSAGLPVPAVSGTDHRTSSRPGARGGTAPRT